MTWGWEIRWPDERATTVSRSRRSKASDHSCASTSSHRYEVPGVAAEMWLAIIWSSLRQLRASPSPGAPGELPSPVADLRRWQHRICAPPQSDESPTKPWRKTRQD